jgi:periplasmic protein TonB
LIKIITPEKRDSDLTVREFTNIKLEQPKKKDAEIPPPPIVQPPPPALRSSIKFVPPIIKPDKEVVEEDFKTQEEVLSSKAAVGVVTYKGVEDVNAAIPKSAEEAESASNQIIEEREEPFVVVEQMPEFPGGNDGLIKYLNSNIRYPAVALENGIQGRVICEFVINRDGRVTEAKVLRGIDPALDAEAIRVINHMPPWKAGKQRGKAVRVRYTLPVNFKLEPM